MTSQLLITMDAEFNQLLCVLPVRKGSIPTILNYYVKVFNHSTDSDSML